MPKHTTTAVNGAERGFTIVELMVTLAIAAILFTVAIPSFNGMIARDRLRTQANEFVANLNIARSEAIRRNSTVAFCRAADDADTTCETGNGNWGHWIIRASNGTIVKRGYINTYNNKLVVT